MVHKVPLLVSGVLGFLLAVDGAHAQTPGKIPVRNGPPVTVPANPPRPVVIKAPEIDATAGVQAIALLTGLLLLVGERARRRKG